MSTIPDQPNTAGDQPSSRSDWFEYIFLPDVSIKDKVLKSEPGAVDDDKEGEAGEAGRPLVHTPGVGQGRGQVDEARDYCPGRVDRPAVEAEPVEDAPPEQRPAPLELVCVSVEVAGHEDDHEHVGDGDGDQEDGGHDDKVGVSDSPVP